MKDLAIGATRTVLILAPVANDGPLSAQTLRAAHIEADVCASMEQVAAGIVKGCGAVVLAEESLTATTISLLQSALDQQPTWSDLPILLLTKADVIRATAVFARSGNISLLERPFSKLVLVRSVEVALRARDKQYQVRDLLRDLEGSKTESERANAAKSQFLANMSHEIRTPMGAIIGFIDILKSGSGDATEQAKYVDIVDRNARHLLRLIDDILDLSKVEAGKITIEKLNFRFDEFLDEFLSTMGTRAADKGLLFRTNFGPAVPNEIVTDPGRLRQVLMNIVGNAIKFTEHGSIELQIDYVKPCLIVSITDTGAGLSKKQISSLFQPFAQADSSVTRKFGGTGLGLVLSRRITEELGGSLQLTRSEVGAGSTFVIKVAVDTTGAEDVLHEGAHHVVQPPPEPTPPISLDGLRVLLVEDAPDNQILIRTYLAKTGAKVETREDGRSGLEAALGGSFDVVLMDIQMPHMDGHTAMRELRNRSYATPVIALTAHAMEEEKKKCEESGFSAYLSKPITRSDLISTLARYI